MIAARMVDRQREKNITTIFGCVTTGAQWQFLKLDDEKLILDSQEYFIRYVDEIVGVFKSVVDFYKSNKQTRSQ